MRAAWPFRSKLGLLIALPTAGLIAFGTCAYLVLQKAGTGGGAGSFILLAVGAGITALVTGLSTIITLSIVATLKRTSNVLRALAAGTCGNTMLNPARNWVKWAKPSIRP